MLLEPQILALCTELCGRYEWMCDDYRHNISAAVVAMRALLLDEEMERKLDAMLAEAQEDARLGRGDAEIEDWMRDVRLARAQSGEAGS